MADEVEVHCGLTAVRVEMPSGELDRLAQHHAEGDFLNTKFIGYLERLTDIIAIFHKRLSWQVRIERLDESLALGSTIDDHTIRSAGLSYRQTFLDGVDKSLLRERFHNA